MAYHYGFAQEQDGVEIAALLESTIFKGQISLCLCRRPNAVLSLAKEGDASTFVVVKDDTAKIVAAGACVIRGDVAYLTGMRAIKRVNIPRCYALLRQFCADHAVRVTYSTILIDNVPVQAMLEKPRANMPQYLRHSESVVHIIKNLLTIKDSHSLHQHNGIYTLKNMSGADIARGEIREQWQHKQYVVKHYGIAMRLAKLFIQWIPDVDTVLKFFVLYNVQAENDTALESFLRHMSHIQHEGSFFLYGGVSCPVASIKYKSIVYIVDWDKKLKDASLVPLHIEIANL